MRDRQNGQSSKSQSTQPRFETGWDTQYKIHTTSLGLFFFFWVTPLPLPTWTSYVNVPLKADRAGRAGQDDRGVRAHPGRLPLRPGGLPRRRAPLRGPRRAPPG